jgi:hypothetical protein
MNANPKPRLLLNFARFSVAELILFCRYVIASLTGNANFTTLNPTLAVSTAATDSLEAAKEAAMDGGRTDRLILSQTKGSTVSLFRQLATSVENQGQSDRAILSSSGFGVTKVPSPVGPIGPPAAPKLIRTKDSGTIKAMVAKIRGVTSVSWRIALQSAPTVYLETVSSSYGRYTFTGLTAGETYLVQASVVGTSGQSAWGPTSALMAL